MPGVANHEDQRSSICRSSAIERYSDASILFMLARNTERGFDSLLRTGTQVSRAKDLARIVSMIQHHHDHRHHQVRC